MANLLSTTVNGALNSTGRITASYDTDRYQMNFYRASASNWWVTNDSGNLGFHLNNVGDRFYFGTGGDFWSSANGWLSTALAGKLSTGGTAANSSQLEGFSAYGLVVEARGAHSGSDFVNGTLVQTDINADGWSGDSFVMEVSGKSYGSGTPFKLVMEGYLYADTIINVSAMSYGSYFPAPVKVMRYNGNVAFWWPRGSYWNSFLVHVRNANGDSWNRVTSITDSVDPTSADKKISITPVQVIHTNNIGSQSVASASTVTHYASRTDGTWYNIIWGAGNPSHLYSSDAVRILSSDGAIRANIYYDNQDTAYYLDPNGTSNLNYLNLGNTREEFPLLRMGAAGRYAIGVSGAHTRISSHNQGSGVQLGSYDGTTFTPKLTVSNDGNVTAESSLRAPIFYDSNDTTYYLDPNSSGKSLNVAGNIDLIARSASWSEGIRVRVPSTSTWGGIRFTRDRGNDDGNWAIGFTGIDASDDLTFWGNTGGEGAMRMRLDQASNLLAYGSMRAPIFYDSENTGYYLDPASRSNLNMLTLSGAGHFFPNTWIELSGYYGLYSPYNSAHFYPNNGNLGAWRIAGTRGGWNGIEFDASNGNVSLMVNPNSNTTGFHNNAYGWQFYWENGTLYCNKNSYGAGTTATVLDSVNYTSWAASSGHTHSYLPLSGGNLTGNLTSTANLDFSGSAYFGTGVSTGGFFNGAGIDVYGTGYIGGNLTVGGSITASGDITAYSDERLKESITTIDNAVALVKQLRGVRYVMKETQKQSVGVIAQETIKALPEVVSESEEGMLSVAYGNIVSVLIEAIKEQQVQLEELKLEIQKLKFN
jgi:hypothetical protein